MLTDEGIRFVVFFYTKLKNGLLSPLLEADKPPAPTSICRALATIEHGLDVYLVHARLGTAA